MIMMGAEHVLVGLMSSSGSGLFIAPTFLWQIYL